MCHWVRKTGFIDPSLHLLHLIELLYGLKVHHSFTQLASIDTGVVTIRIPVFYEATCFWSTVMMVYVDGVGSSY